MRRPLVTLTAGVALLGLAAQSTAASRPSLQVTHFAPVTVAGAGFEPGERVVVTVVSGKDKHVRAVRAAASGRFRVRFDVRATLRCGGALRASALDSHGARVAAKLPKPQCPPDG
jgi:hypothetical protein